jgi:hypothetical protein
LQMIDDEPRMLAKRFDLPIYEPSLSRSLA